MCQAPGAARIVIFRYSRDVEQSLRFQQSAGGLWCRRGLSIAVWAPHGGFGFGHDMVDHDRFDAWVKTTTANRSRRDLTRLLGGLVLCGFPVLHADGAEGRRKRRKNRRRTCPRGEKRCAGKCQECCTVTDCRPTLQTDGLACIEGRCVCTIEGTQRCPANTDWAGFCGHCCRQSDCEGIVSGCGVFISGPPTCDCGTNVFCDQVCVHFECDGKCAITCNVPGTPAAGEACCLDGSLTCQPARTEDDPNKHRCLPLL